MDLTFSGIIDLIANNFFDGSTTLAGLSLLLVCWGICAVICMNMKAPPTYTLVPMIPLAIFFSAYGILNTTVMVIIIVISSVLVAIAAKKAVD